MNGKKYEIKMAPACHRIYKKFDDPLKDRIKEESKKIATSPYSAKHLSHPLKGIYSYIFHYKNSEYRIAYRVNEENNLVEIVLVKSRENFYAVLKRMLINPSGG